MGRNGLAALLAGTIVVAAIPGIAYCRGRAETPKTEIPADIIFKPARSLIVNDKGEITGIYLLLGGGLKFPKENIIVWKGYSKSKLTDSDKELVKEYDDLLKNTRINWNNEGFAHYKLDESSWEHFTYKRSYWEYILPQIKTIEPEENDRNKENVAYYDQETGKLSRDTLILKMSDDYDPKESIKREPSLEKVLIEMSEMSGVSVDITLENGNIYYTIKPR